MKYEEKHGEEKALNLMRIEFEGKLKPAYDNLGFRKGNPEDFARCVGERDRGVGLEVSFVLSQDRIVYRFHTDPFPGLRGKVSMEKFYATFMDFKVDYILGQDWHYEMTKHIHKGDKFTEFVIEKFSELALPKTGLVQRAHV